MFKFIKKIFKEKESVAYEYGFVRLTRRGFQNARRNINTGAVEFVLWNKGEQGHSEDFWHEFDKSHWQNFTTSECV